jgi:hypothetical protein
LISIGSKFYVSWTTSKTDVDRFPESPKKREILYFPAGGT